MRILITGGAGYVGSACLRHLLQSKHEVIAFDDLSTGNEQAVAGATLVRGDICDHDAVRNALKVESVDAVMHFAALTSVPDSIDDPSTYWNINTLGTKTILDAMRQTGVNQIILSSTAAVYGHDSTTPIPETSRATPRVPYGSTKLAAEQLLCEYATAYGLGVGVLRYFNAAGADLDGQHGECRRAESHLIPLVLEAALTQQTIRVFGSNHPTRDGTCVRDYVHVSDIAMAHELLLAHLEPGKARTYNVGSGRGSTVMEVVAACSEVSNVHIPIEYTEPRPGDPPILLADSAKLELDLGWRARHSSIQSIVETAWRWHNAHPNGYTR